MIKLSGLLAACAVSAALLLLAVIAGQWALIHFPRMPRWFDPAVGLVSVLMLLLASAQVRRAKKKQEQEPMTPLPRAPIKGSRKL